MRHLNRLLIVGVFLAAVFAGMGTHIEAQPPFVVFGSSSTTGTSQVIKSTSNALWVSLQSVASALLVSDGTVGAPSIAFTNETTLGIYRVSAALGRLVGNWRVSGTLTGDAGIVATTTINLGTTSNLSWESATRLQSVADGNLVVKNTAQTIGSQFKVDALPTVSSCGAGSPAVTAGSTPLAGSVTIGTTAVVTCTITFGGTAFPSAPFCTSDVVTATAANIRAIGVTPSTTALVLVPAAAWADSAVVSWHCISSK